MGFFGDVGNFVGGGVGGMVSSILGSKNDASVQAQKDVYQVDPNAYNYGGTANGAAIAAGAATGNQATDNQAMSSYQNQQNNLYNYGVSSLDAANGARNAQTDALSMMRDRANGNDLVSRMVAEDARRKLIASQGSLAASARGPAALALAQQTAAGNTSAGQQGIAAQEGINAANERLGYTTAYANQGNAIRGADIGQAGTSFGAGAQSGGLGIQSGGLGLGYAGLANNINQAQLTASMNEQSQKSANIGGAQSLNAQVAGQNAATNQQNGMGVIGAGTGLTGAGAGGPKPQAAAVGGRTDGGHPYLVGEQGPELIVPKKDGFVFTAPQTQFLLATMTPEQKRALGGGVSGYARAMGGPLCAARADGGPVDGQTPPWLDQYAPAPATWGTAPNYQAQAAAMRAGPDVDARRGVYEADLAGRPVDTGLGMTTGIALAPLYRQAAGERLSGQPENAAVLAGMKSAGVQTEGQKANEKAAAAEKKPEAEAKKPTMAQIVGGTASDIANRTDTRYHGGGGYVAPQLLALPAARALGGPVAGSSAAGDPMGYAVLMPGGGMDVMGSLAANAGAGTSFLKSPGFAREEGGDVKAGAVTYHTDNASKAGHEIAGTFTQHLKGAGMTAANLLGGLALSSPAAQALGYALQPVANAGAAAGRADAAAAAAPAVVVPAAAPQAQAPMVVAMVPASSSGGADMMKARDSGEVPGRAMGGLVRAKKKKGGC